MYVTLQMDKFLGVTLLTIQTVALQLMVKHVRMFGLVHM